MYIFPCIKFIYSNMSFYFFVFFLKSTPYGTGAPRPHVGNCALSPHFPYGSIQFGRKIKGSGISWQKILAFSSQLHPSISCKNGENIQNCIMRYVIESILLISYIKACLFLTSLKNNGQIFYSIKTCREKK